MRTVALALLLVLAPMQAMGCALAINTGGILKLSSDGTRLGSDEPGGTAAAFVVSNALLAGDFRVTISRPTVTDAPNAFDRAAAITYYSYVGGGLLGASSSSGGYVTSTSSFFDVKGLLSALAATMTLDNRVTSPGGFRAGHYQTTTVITCSPL
jgi:hypothetical protein